MKENTLLDLIENNKDYEDRVSNFQKREFVAGHFLSTNEFIDNEIVQFLEVVKKPSEFSISVNNMPAVTPFNIYNLSTKAYQFLMKGYDMPIKRLIEDAKKECLKAKEAQQKQYGRAFAFTPCEGEFENFVTK